MPVPIYHSCLFPSHLSPPPHCMQSRVEEGETKVEATLMPDLAPVQREMVRTMQPQVRQGGRRGRAGWSAMYYVAMTEGWEERGGGETCLTQMRGGAGMGRRKR